MPDVTMDARAEVEAALAAIEPGDRMESAQRADALAWVRSGAGIWRLAKPATPPKHLVAYVLLVDPADGSCLLVDHRKARLWLPAGGHVEPGEPPAITARREAGEELGVEPPLLGGLSSNPLFVSQAMTVATDAGHTDVSLWYVCQADSAAPIAPDPVEIGAARWWAWGEILEADPAGFDPHLPRFLTKLVAELST